MSYAINNRLTQILFIALILFFCYILLYSHPALASLDIAIIVAILTLAGYGLWTTIKKRGRKKK